MNTVRQASNRYNRVLQINGLVIYFSDDMRTLAVYAKYYNALGWRPFSGVRIAGGRFASDGFYRVLEDVRY